MADVFATLSAADARAAENSFVTKVYGWMAFGLLVTAVVALGVASSDGMVETIAGTPALVYGLIIGELGLVLVLTMGINRLSPATATGLFVLFAGVNGLTLSIIFVIYTAASLTTTFVITAGTFGAMSLYGYTTKRDLTSIGNLCFMGLIGIILASIVNIFLRNEAVYWVVSYAGVLIFVGLTAYDAQRIKQMARGMVDGSAMAHRAAILGALRLYLDFINLFLFLLRIFGRRR